MEPIDILIIEDNEGDIFLIREALQVAKIARSVHVAKDGLQAMHFLLKMGNYLDTLTPDLILLDLNLPKLNGQEVLKRIKEDTNLCHIPVIILSTSSSQVDALKSYSNNADKYITKPFDAAALVEVVEKIREFWMHNIQMTKTH